MASDAVMATSPPFKLDAGTAFSLGVAFSLMPSAQILASYALPKSTSRKLYYVFLWHAYDFLTHFIIEGSYLYHCFFSYQQLPAKTPDISHPAAWGGEPQAYLYNQPDRRYGAIYSQAPMARLWQEYAKADRRWGGADLTVISLEIVSPHPLGIRAHRSKDALYYLLYVGDQIADTTFEGPSAYRRPGWTCCNVHLLSRHQDHKFEG